MRKWRLGSRNIQCCIRNGLLVYTILEPIVVITPDKPSKTGGGLSISQLKTKTLWTASLKNVANSIAFLIVPGGSKQRGNRTKAAGQDNIVTACAHFAVSVSRVKSFIIRILKRFNVELLFF